MVTKNVHSIALVDDDDNILASVADILEAKRYKVTSYQDPQDAILKIKETSPDLVISDITMPGIDGIEMVTRIRANSPDQKIILMSGDTSEILIRRTDQINETNPGNRIIFLEKPIRTEHLLECVSLVLDG